MAAARQLVVRGRHQPKLVLAQPPPCAATPLALVDATLRHPQGSLPIFEGLSLTLALTLSLALTLTLTLTLALTLALTLTLTLTLILILIDQ